MIVTIYALDAFFFYLLTFADALCYSWDRFPCLLYLTQLLAQTSRAMSDVSNMVSPLHFPAYLIYLCFYVLFAIECSFLLLRDEPLGSIWFLPPGRGLKSLHFSSLHSYMSCDP